MSQIGKKPIDIPSQVQVDFNDGVIKVSKEGSELSRKVFPEISVDIKDSRLFLKRKNNDKKSKELHGLIRSLIANMITGVNEGFSKELNLVGVGYTVESKGDFLLLNLGYSHAIFFEKPEGISFEVPNNTTVIIKGTDNQLVGDVAAKIRELRKPEPYKGKGVKYKDEYIKRKAGKTVGGAGS
ncbi:MAG: 50S ribosomal protein L6 [Candidatus Marinimicrobia bacterium]|nr:50S ribosomal protein L6 [Candidatus Neomarinimicrobiota bacterium]|tara:strand:- start:5186 stop:5734 length:549 start_codon:yes stop_codon:yes gene_type:complete